jgi:hypothetical protein
MVSPFSRWSTRIRYKDKIKRINLSIIDLLLVNGGRGEDVEGRTGWGRIITIVRRFLEASPPNTDLGACPLNSLNINRILPKVWGTYRRSRTYVNLLYLEDT